MNKTKIEWADYTFNPVTGCAPISEGCKNCYAKALAEKWQKGLTKMSYIDIIGAWKTKKHHEIT